MTQTPSDLHDDDFEDEEVEETEDADEPEDVDSDDPEDAETPPSADDSDDDSAAEHGDTADQPEDEPEEPAVAEAQPAAAETETHSEPLRLRIDRQHLDIPGAQVIRGAGLDEDHVVMPKSVFDQFVHPRMVFDRVQYAKNVERQIRPQVEAEIAKSHPAVLRAATLVKKLDEAFGSEDSAAEFLADFDKNVRLLRSEVENEVLKAEKSGVAARLTPYEEDARIQEALPVAEEHVDRISDLAINLPALKGTAVTRTDIQQLLVENLDQVLTVDESGQITGVNQQGVLRVLNPLFVMAERSKPAQPAAAPAASTTVSRAAKTVVAAAGKRPAAPAAAPAQRTQQPKKAVVQQDRPKRPLTREEQRARWEKQLRDL